MSLVPTSGPNSWRPDAIGDKTNFGTPIGKVISAPAPITEPSAPPIPMAPRTSPLEKSSFTFSITKVLMRSTARPRVPEFCNSCRVIPPKIARSSCEISGTIPSGSPRIPVSITVVLIPRRFKPSRI